MHQRILANKNFFASMVLLLIAASLFADMAFPGARQTNEISTSNRMLCHAIQIAILGAMAVFVFCNYSLPRVPAVMLWELGLIGFLCLSTCHLAFISSREQLITFTKFAYWPIGYFFFRIVADDVRGYRKLLLFLIISLSIFAVWSYLSQAELRAEITERVGTAASSNVGWTLLSIFALSLGLAEAGERKGYVIGAVALVLTPLSLKRGAILAEAAVCLSLIVAGSRLGRLRPFLRKNGHWVAGIFAIWFIVCMSRLEWLTERFSGLMDDGGSGRSQFYPLLFERWRQADLFHWFFGFGFWSTPAYLDRVWLDHIYAHSDVLEMLHDYGAIGVLSYGTIVVGLLALCGCTWRRRDTGFVIAAAVFSHFLVTGLISGNVMFRETIYLMIPLGYVTGRLLKVQEAGDAWEYVPGPFGSRPCPYPLP